MLEKAKARNRDINFVRGDLSSLPFDGSKFDLTICALAITHYPDIVKFLSELKRVTRLGGNVIISDIHPWFVTLGAQADFYAKDNKWGYIKNYIHWHSAYIKAFDSLGLKLLRCEEPRLGEGEIQVVASKSNLSIETIRTALLGLPVALVWVLQRA